MATRAFTAALATGLALAAFAGGASAGTYHVYSCRMPDGQAAPVDGWSGSVVGTYAYANDTCEAGGALSAALEDPVVREANAGDATWRFAAPASETLAGAVLWRFGDADGGAAINASYEFWLGGPGSTTVFDECLYVFSCTEQGTPDQPMDPGNKIEVPPSSLGSELEVVAECGGDAGYKCPAGKGDANGFAAAVYLYAADLTLEQPEGPRASDVSGELASAATVHGDSDIAFDATDPGSGVYEAVFSVDGEVVQRTVIDEDGGRCRDVGQTSDGTAAFLYVQPCLASVSADVPLDTTRLANGAHHLVVSVTDAAGNAAPVLDRTITIDNPLSPSAPKPPGPPNGVGATTAASLSVRWQATRAATMLSGFGRAQSLGGALTAPGGQPIAGAAIEVRATPAYQGARSAALGSVRTDAHGRFALRLPAGVSSRTLRFEYRAHVGEALPVAVRTLRLVVRAGIVLSVAPHTTSVGRSILFRGQLLGGPVPGAGKQLVLEARSPGSAWIEFDVVRTDARGRFHASYRFKFAGPADYTFRVRSEPESDYPFAAGASNTVGVYEG